MPRIVDLDSLALEPTTVVLRDKEYKVAEPNLETFLEIQRVSRRTGFDGTGTLTKKKADGLLHMIQILLPGLPDEVAKDLTARQLTALNEILGEYISPSDEDMDKLMGREPSEEGKEDEDLGE